MKFYFAGAIRGGRDKIQTFIKINEVLKKYGQVLDEHVANPNVNVIEQNHSLSEIYNRDIRWIKACDLVVAEVSTASLGVGYELCYAEHLGIPIIVLYDKSINVSAMILGNEYFDLIPYDNDEDLLVKLDNKVKVLKKNKGVDL